MKRHTLNARSSVSLTVRALTGPRPGRSVAAVVIYLAGFVVLLLFVSHYYLLPALSATKNADPRQKEMLSAHAAAILMIVLFILFAGLVLTFRIGRFFRPRQEGTRKPTVYVDAWKESGRRLKTPK